MTPTKHDVPHHYTAAEMHNRDVGYEHADVNLRTIVAFGIGIAAMVIVSAVLMWIMFGALESQAAKRDPQLSPVALPTNQQPPSPRLLTNEPANLNSFGAEETKKLDGYGWVDERGGIAHVPIDQAKKLIVQHGLPVRTSGAVDDARTGTHAPAYGEANGGRTIASPKTAAAATPAAPQTPAADVKK